MKKFGETLIVWFKVLLVVLVLFGGYRLYQRYTQDKLPIFQSKKIEAKVKVVTKAPKKTKIVSEIIKRGKNKITIRHTITPDIPDALKSLYLEMEEDPEFVFEEDVFFSHIEITHSVGIYRSPHAIFVGFGQRLNSMPFTEIYMNTLFLFGKSNTDQAVSAIGFCLSQEVMPHLSIGIGGIYSTLGMPEVILGINYGW